MAPVLAIAGMVARTVDVWPFDPVGEISQPIVTGSSWIVTCAVRLRIRDCSRCNFRSLPPLLLILRSQRTRVTRPLNGRDRPVGFVTLHRLYQEVVQTARAVIKVSVITINNRKSMEAGESEYSGVLKTRNLLIC
jgi:hypothetical protein